MGSYRASLHLHAADHQVPGREDRCCHGTRGCPAMSVRRVLIIGCNGLLGQKVTELFVRGSSYTVTLASLEPKPLQSFPAVEYLAFDMTSKKEVRQVVYGCEPDVIIN